MTASWLRCRIPHTVAAVLALLPVLTNADVLTGGNYEPKPNDTYVQMNSGACCVGEYHSISNVYIGQSFVATGRIPYSITLGLANNLPADVPPADPKFRLLLTELGPTGFQPTKVLWESGALVVSASNFAEYTYEIRGVHPGAWYSVRLDSGHLYRPRRSAGRDVVLLELR